MMWAVTWDPWCFFLTTLTGVSVHRNTAGMDLHATKMPGPFSCTEEPEKMVQKQENRQKKKKNPRRDSSTCQKFQSQCSRGLNVLACPCCWSQMRCKYSWPKQGFRLLTAFAASAIPTVLWFRWKSASLQLPAFGLHLQLHFPVPWAGPELCSDVLTCVQWLSWLETPGQPVAFGMCILVRLFMALLGVYVSWSCFSQSKEGCFVNVGQAPQAELCFWNSFGCAVPLLCPKTSLLFQEETCFLLRMTFSVV